jgi:hypothetical protein
LQKAKYAWQISLELIGARVIRAAKGDPPQFGQNRPLQALHEAIRPGMPGFGAPVLDPRDSTGRGELR